MIFNPEELQKAKISPAEFVALLTVNVKQPAYLVNSTKEIKNLMSKELVAFIKEKTQVEFNEDNFHKLRVTKKGKALLNKISTSVITEEIKELGQSLIDTYEQYGHHERLPKSIPKVQRLLAWFVESTPYTAAQIVDTVKYLCVTTETKFVPYLDNLIWKPENVFQAKPSLERSKLNNLLSAQSA